MLVQNPFNPQSGTAGAITSITSSDNSLTITGTTTRDIIVNTAHNFTWTGIHTFNKNGSGVGVIISDDTVIQLGSVGAGGVPVLVGFSTGFSSAGVFTDDGAEQYLHWVGNSFTQFDMAVYSGFSNVNAWVIEQTGVHPDLLHIDTTNGTMGIYSAPASGITLALGAPTNRSQVLNTSRVLSTRITNAKVWGSTDTINWSGTSTGYNSNDWSILDARQISGAAGGSQTMNGLSAVVNTTGYTFAYSSVSPIDTHIGVTFTANNSGTYSSNPTTLTVQNFGAQFSSTNSPVLNTTGTTVRVLTIGGTFSAISGPSGSFATPIVDVIGGRFTASGSSTGTSLAIGSLISAVSGADKNWGVFINLAQDTYLVADGGKIWLGTNTNTPNSSTQGAYGATGDAYLDFTGSELEIVSDAVTSTDSILIRAGTNGLKLNIGGTQQAILTSNLLTTSSGVNIASGGVFTKYNNIAVEAYGVAAIVDDVAITGRTTAITTTNFTNAGTAGTYRVSYSLQDTTADITAGTLTLTIAYTDGGGATTKTATQVLTATGRADGVVYLQLASGNVTYAVAITGGVGIGAATYALFASCERLS